MTSALFVLLFCSIQFIPDSFIYFRFWERESLLKNDETDLVMPQFTPNLDYFSMDEGDQNHDMSCAIKKPIHWFTDQYGFRNKIRLQNANIVFAGCSNTQGCNTSYENTFTGILNIDSNNIYNCAPDYTLDYLSQLFDLEKPQHIQQIFIVQVARYFTYKDAYKAKPIKRIEYNAWEQKLVHINENHAGRKLKKYMTGFLKSCDGKPHFYGTKPDTTWVHDNINDLKKKIDFFTQKGIKVSIIIIPDKESFSDQMNLSQLNLANYQCIYRTLLNAKIYVIDILPIFSIAKLNNYAHGDGHINENGHQLIANFIAPKL